MFKKNNLEFEKKLDNYHTIKLRDFIVNQIYPFWNVDVKADYNCIYIKRKKYNDNQYRLLFNFTPKDALSLLCNQNALKDEIQKYIKDYFEETKEV